MEDPEDEDNVGRDLRDRYCKQRWNPLSTRAIKEKRFVREKTEDQKEEPDEEKEQQRLIGRPGRGALQAREIPVAVTPPTLKKRARRRSECGDDRDGNCRRA